MSTKVIRAGMTLALLAIAASRSSRGSGTFTSPTFGSMVQKGKFAACAAAVRVSALKSVDLPTFGSPTIPIFNAIPPSAARAPLMARAGGRSSARGGRRAQLAGQHADLRRELPPEMADFSKPPPRRSPAPARRWSATSRLARSIRRASTYWCGASPVAARKLRAKWKGLRPASAASSARVSVSSSRASTASATRASARGVEPRAGARRQPVLARQHPPASRCARLLASMSRKLGPSDHRPPQPVGDAEQRRVAAEGRRPRRAERRLELEARHPGLVGVGARISARSG